MIAAPIFFAAHKTHKLTYSRKNLGQISHFRRTVFPVLKKTALGAHVHEIF